MRATWVAVLDRVARYLHEHGVPVCGVDLSPAMVERARRLVPGVEFRQGDMMALNAPDGAWAGITAFYSVISHSPQRHGKGAAVSFGEFCDRTDCCC